MVAKSVRAVKTNIKFVFRKFPWVVMVFTCLSFVFGFLSAAIYQCA